MSAMSMSGQHGSETVTHGVRVAVRPAYLADESLPEREQYLFRYNVTITNESEHDVQVLGRHWWIIDAEGETEEVVGEGVVGEQPTIEPGGSHRYHSFCPLPTPWGTMEGVYHVVDSSGDAFDVTIGRFFLVAQRESAGV